MVVKDWKKWKKDSWITHNKDRYIEIIRSHQKGYNPVYDVWMVSMKNGKVLRHNDLDTRARAIKSAKAYMKIKEVV
jgi:hypothetical protein